MARKADSIWVTKGKRLIQFDPASSATDDDIATLILGRSGTLRAPAILTESVFMVGFNEEAFTTLFD